MVPVDEATVVEKGALGPGQMIAVDMKKEQLFHDTEIKDKLAAAQPFGEWVGKINDLDDALTRRDRNGAVRAARSCASGRSRPAIPSRSWSRSLRPMAEDGKEALASMGDDTPSAVLSNQYRPLEPFLPAEFQPGDQPADRQFARIPGDEPEDAVREPEERAGRGFVADRDSRAGQPVRGQCAVRRDGDAFQRQRGRDRLYLRRRMRGGRRCARVWSVSGPRPRMPCGRVRGISC